MKTAKHSSAAEASSSHRRSQPVRQTRTNPPRTSAGPSRADDGRRDSLAASAPAADQPIEIFPAITHFADTITALPKELVRHFTLLKELDAKLFAPEEQLFKLIAATTATGVGLSTETQTNNDPSNADAAASTQNGENSMAIDNTSQQAPATNEADNASIGVFAPSNVPRRQLFRQTAFKIQEMLVALEEKNHVISTANEALQRQLNRIDDVWPDLQNEFSDEAKWGSTTHWAYPENRTGKLSNADRTRRDGAAVISAAAQALADEAAARSDARKQAVQANKNKKNQHVLDSDFDDQDARPKKSHASKSRKLADSGNVGLGISTAANGNPPPKKRKVDKSANGGAASERAMASVFGGSGQKGKAASPRGTPAPDGPKKRKALPSGSAQAKKSRSGAAMSPAMASSPIPTANPDTNPPIRPSPAPSNAPRTASSRARQNSLQSNSDASRSKAALSIANKTNGHTGGTQDATAATTSTTTTAESKPSKESSVPAKGDSIKKEQDRTETSSTTTQSSSKNDRKANEADRKSESLPPAPPMVTTKSGRASKPSTPALATFQEAARPRSSRNADSGGGGKKGHKRSASTAQPVVARIPDEEAMSSAPNDDEDADIDADEPTYCYCNSVSYGEMVACDADDCEREWFHLACVGLKVAPSSKTKWYCEDCKERLKMGAKKVNGR